MSLTATTLQILQLILYQFCFDWYSYSEQKEDIVYSPYSMSMAFSMLYLGSSGKTRKQIGDVFGFSQIPDKEIIDSMKELLKPITKQREGNDELSDPLEVANALWIDKRATLKEKYLKQVKELEAKLNGMNTLTEEGQQKAVDDVNNFVRETTHGLIEEILTKEMVNEMTSVIIANAIYFKGTWEKEFKLEDEKLLFNKLENVTQMKVDFKTNIQLTEDAEVVNIPYSDNGDYSMVVVMPRNMKEFQKKYFEKGNNKKELMDLFVNTRKGGREITHLTMPKFKLKSEFSMTGQLKKMNMKLPFTDGLADFSEMAYNGMYVSDAIHKCVVDVDEKGTEAAGATVIIMSYFSGCMGCHSYTPEEYWITIDKPFFFAIIGGDNHIPYFFGQVTHPK